MWKSFNNVSSRYDAWNSTEHNPLQFFTESLPVESAKWGDHRVDASAQRTVLMIKTVNKLKWDEMEKAVIMANR